MLKRLLQEPVTDQAFPFASAVGKYGFEEAGYLEEEFFMYGTANLYNENGVDSFDVLHRDVPYCNRFLLRRPGEKTEFSGNVIIEILNPTARIDLDRMWAISGKHFMRQGDIYIGITSKPDTFDALLEFDRERYGKLNWSYPGEREAPAAPANPVLPLPNPKMETGLFWDMLTDLALLLRSDDAMNPVRAYGPAKVILTGWSQSACYLWTYVKYLAFHPDYNRGQCLFDGYLAAGGVHSFAVPLNQEGYGRTSKPSDTMLRFMPVPYIAAQTESENARMGGFEARQEDSDSESFHYRIYEIAGATHDNRQTLFDYYQNDRAFARRKVQMVQLDPDELPLDYPYQYPFNAMYAHLCRWVRDGVLPPHGKRIAVNEATLENKTDEHGNAVGGVRSPFIDVPTCTYKPQNSFRCGDYKLMGEIRPFTPEKLTELYGDIQNYRALAERSADRLIEEGFLLQEDRFELLEEAVKLAGERWRLQEPSGRL